MAACDFVKPRENRWGKVASLSNSTWISTQFYEAKTTCISVLDIYRCKTYQDGIYFPLSGHRSNLCCGACLIFFFYSMASLQVSCLLTSAIAQLENLKHWTWVCWWRRHRSVVLILCLLFEEPCHMMHCCPQARRNFQPSVWRFPESASVVEWNPWRKMSKYNTPELKNLAWCLIKIIFSRTTWF